MAGLNGETQTDRLSEESSPAAPRTPARQTARRNIRIVNVSGATGVSHALARIVREADVDVLTADLHHPERDPAWNASGWPGEPDLGHAADFLDQLQECLDDVVATGVKIVANAGATDAAALSRRVEELCSSAGHEDVVVATVVGSDVSNLVQDATESRHGSSFPFRHLHHEEQLLHEWYPGRQPTSAVACIGAWGIAAALREGADIVVCGRVTGASPVMGAAAWWYGWQVDAYNELAGALVAGHLIERGPHTSGADHAGSGQHLPDLLDLAPPIAEIHSDGSCFLTKVATVPGSVNKTNITAQLLHGQQGSLSPHPDVLADLSKVSVVESGERNTVYVSGTIGYPPPATTRVLITAPGDWQAEATYYLTGLDILARAQAMKSELAHRFRDSNFSHFSVELYGSQASNPSSQQEGTVTLRVLAQAREQEDLSAEKFRDPLTALRLQDAPGCDMSPTARAMDPAPFAAVFPSTIPQSAIEHKVLIPKLGRSIPIPHPAKTATYPISRPSSHETTAPVDLKSFGEVLHEPLGHVVCARSGTQDGNTSLAFFVRHRDEYPWLQALLTVDKLKELLGQDYSGQKVERVEFPVLWAVHFRILDFPSDGMTPTARIDSTGTGVGEYLRSRHADIPVRFLNRIRN
ncbi:hypothetical protein LTR53_017542 [Teratosphaeriaceae sp. CCFEE 6253]|nr:hypothetical protein LTR53_017542 [Teratosphaeriaceae sp. CCFEE 6253]